MLRITNLKIPANRELTEAVLKQAIERRLGAKGAKNIKIIRRAIDPRDKTRVSHVLTLDFDIAGEKRFYRKKNITRPERRTYTLPEPCRMDIRPVIAGFGPAGMFCGLALAEMGLRPVILERGRRVSDRKRDIETFQRTRVLDPSSNVQFGEGGAGTFSDGKLNTGINDVRCDYILRRFVEFGAPDSILSLAKPHIGTDNLVIAVKNLRERILSLGGEILFEHTLTDIDIESGKVTAVHGGNEIKIPFTDLVLAVGHSARDTFEMLYKKGFDIEQKAFSVGVRIEHKQDAINRAQYGDFAQYLPAADYKLFTHLENGRGVYTFCMCPGGYVMAAASEEGGVVTNGMSCYARDGENANAALLVGVGPDDFDGTHPLAGVKLQRELERKAFAAGGSNYNAPAQTVGDLLNDRPTEKFGNVVPSYRPGVTPSDMRKIFPACIYDSIKQGILAFDKTIKGYADENAVVTAVESRSSSPVRITRGKDSLESIKYPHIYPCGEGCGYAGGIMSAAADGLKVAEKIALNTV